MNLVGNEDLIHLQDSGITEIIRKGKGRMPAFPLPSAELETLDALPASAEPAATAPASAVSTHEGEELFFGSGGCSSCHAVRGRGSANGPDLSDIGSKLREADLTAALTDPQYTDRTGLRDGDGHHEGWQHAAWICQGAANP